MANSAASLISITTGIRGPSLTVSTACSSSTHAIGLAAWMVHHGLAPWAIAGGSEAPFSYGHLKAWESLQVVSRDTCRPFDRERTGLILGEGGAMLVLERREDAIARGARVYAEVAGFGMRSDAHHITQPDPAGAAATICAALNDADIQAQDVGYVNAHGTGTLANDRVESEALQLALGNHGHVVPVSSSKSAHGHALGATGALEAITSVLALHHGSIPPTLNVREQDPQCPIHLVKDAAMLSNNLGFAMSNSLAFGGTNACLIFRNHES
jgi:nodulation protein E